jgi:hypothetical protein
MNERMNENPLEYLITNWLGKIFRAFYGNECSFLRSQEFAASLDPLLSLMNSRKLPHTLFLSREHLNNILLTPLGLQVVVSILYFRLKLCVYVKESSYIFFCFIKF